MSAEFDITVDGPRRLLDVRMGGFFSLADVRRYHAEVTAASERLGGDPGAQAMLCDITAMRIQAQDVVEAFRLVMADPRYAARRIAFVVSASLARMQVQRAAGRRTAQTFATRDDAEAWLLGEGRAAA